MQGVNSTALEQHSNSQNQGRKILLTIVAIPVLVIVASSLLYYLANNRMIDLGTVNNGELLLPPVAMTEQSLAKEDRTPISWPTDQGQWRFVVFSDGACLDACQKMLYLSRQSHIALAKKMHFVARSFVTTSPVQDENLIDQFSTEYADTDRWLVDANALRTALEKSGVDPFAPGQFFVVDHRGWLMMVYRAESLDQESLNKLGKDVLADMKRLLQ